LAIIDQLELLRVIFDDVIIPKSVYDEVIINGKNKSGYAELARINWLKVIAINNIVMKRAMMAKLDEGEAEVIILASELRTKMVCIDEVAGRRYARFMGLDVIGTLGILLIAKNKGTINEIKPLIDKMIDSHIYIRKELYYDILTRANEM